MQHFCSCSSNGRWATGNLGQVEPGHSRRGPNLAGKPSLHICPSGQREQVSSSHHHTSSGGQPHSQPQPGSCRAQLSSVQTNKLTQRLTQSTWCPGSAAVPLRHLRGLNFIPAAAPPPASPALAGVVWQGVRPQQWWAPQVCSVCLFVHTKIPGAYRGLG